MEVLRYLYKNHTVLFVKQIFYILLDKKVYK